MKLSVVVYECINQKVLYIPDINYYFGICENQDISIGNHILSVDEILEIYRESNPEEYETFIKTSIKERLDKVSDFDVNELKEEARCSQFTLCLHPSRLCNLNCRYCFKESEYLDKESLSYHTAKDAIDFFVDRYAPNASKYVVDLSGSGEPLLNFDLIKQIINYCKYKRNQIGKNIELMFCSNLTLLTPEMAEYLDSEPFVILGVSIDGDQLTNDKNRIYLDGSGTYEDVLDHLKLFKNKKLGVAVTVTPLNQDVDIIYDHLYKLPNVDCVSMRFIRDFGSSEYNTENIDVQYLSDRYGVLCSNILRNLENGNFDYLEKLIKGADLFGGYLKKALFKGIVAPYRCDAGRMRIAINYSGNVYACSTMMGNESFFLGNIYKGGSTSDRESFFSPNTLMSAKCRSCNLHYMCGGECYAVAYLKNNKLFEPYDKMCSIKKELAHLSMAFVEILKKNNHYMYKKLLEYLFFMQSFCQTDSGVWALASIMKKLNKNISFDGISKEIQISNQGVAPTDFLSCINSYFSNYEAYRVNELSDFTRLSFPIVALLNKRSLTRYDYMIIERVDGDFLESLSVSSNNAYKIKIEDFLKDYSDIVLAKALE